MPTYDTGQARSQSQAPIADVMSRIRLLPVQTAAVEAAAVQAGFNLEDFGWGLIESDWAGYPGDRLPAYEHSESRAYFGFSRDPDDVDPYAYGPQNRSNLWRVIYAPGKDSETDKDDHLSWDQVRRLVVEWLNSLRANLEASGRLRPTTKEPHVGNAGAIWPKKFTNRFAAAIASAGLSINAFTTAYEIVDGNSSYVVSVRDSSLRFIARCTPELRFDAAFNRFAPGLPLTDYIPAAGWFVDIEGVLEEFTRWLREDATAMVEEASAPDLWSDIGSAISNLGTFDDRFTTFSDVEQSVVQRVLNDFREDVVRVFQPTPTQLDRIESELKYLGAAAGRLNKFDWKGVAINTLIAIGVALSLDVERGRELMNLFQAAIAGALHLLK